MDQQVYACWLTDSLLQQFPWSWTEQNAIPAEFALHSQSQCLEKWNAVSLSPLSFSKKMFFNWIRDIRMICVPSMWCWTSFSKSHFLPIQSARQLWSHCLDANILGLFFWKNSHGDYVAESGGPWVESHRKMPLRSLRALATISSLTFSTPPVERILARSFELHQ